VPLVPAILAPGCIGLGVLVLNVLPPPPVNLEGIPLNYLRFLSSRIVPWGQLHEPTRWADIQEYYQKYRYWILFFAKANIVYFISLAGYFLLMGSRMNEELNSETTGALNYTFWTIMNCFIMIVACMSLIFSNIESTEESFRRDWRP
jgi:hypothetical protein